MNRINVLLSIVLLATGLTGCRTRTNTVHVTAYRDAADPDVYVQNFDAASFRKTGDGEYEILMESPAPNVVHAEQSPSRQTLHIRMFWTALPGKTYAESSQINASMTYRYRKLRGSDSPVTRYAPGPVLTFEGTGFVSLDAPKKDADRLTGRIERAMLSPAHRAESAGLGSLIVEGTFSARRDESRLIEYKVTR